MEPSHCVCDDNDVSLYLSHWMGGYMGRSKKERKILGSITRWVWVAKTKNLEK